MWSLITLGLTKSKPSQIIKIEGVFSGTMSYIFNNFSNGKADGPTFSSVVAFAKEKGYTVSPNDLLPDLSLTNECRNLTQRTTSTASMLLAS